MSKAEVRGFEALLGGVAFVDFVESHAEAWMVLGRRAVVDVLKQNYKWRFFKQFHFDIPLSSFQRREQRRPRWTKFEAAS